MPTPRKSNPTPNGPVKKAPAKRVRKAPTVADTPAAQGIAAKRAQMRAEDGQALDPYAPTVWGAEEASGSLVDLTLPSGQVVLAQRPGPEGLMVAGLLDDLDMLASVLPKVVGGKSVSKDLDAMAVVKNPKMLQQAMALMNRVAVYVVIKPELTPEPEDPADKEKGKIYPSTVSMEDKTFLFNWAVGGTRDLATFRGKLSESVASLESVADTEGETI